MQEEVEEEVEIFERAIKEREEKGERQEKEWGSGQ